MNSSTERILAGLIGKPFGMRGHLTVRVESDDPDRFVLGARFPGPDGVDLVVDDVREADKGIHLRFAGYHTRDAAESLRGHRLTIAASERRQLDEGEFWPDELVGLSAISRDGTVLGEVTALVEGHAQDRLRIQTASGSEYEVPFVRDLIPDVDIGRGTVTVATIPGLID